MESLHKLLAEVETDEDPDIVNEDNGLEDVLEEIFSDHESFCEHDMESEEDGNSENEDENILKLLSSKEGNEKRKTKFSYGEGNELGSKKYLHLQESYGQSSILLFKISQNA
ncbi:hypothetical protein AVEN_234354-1 [Araneus ventricosus]|uniref:Uncharacterized protein n=1 Tax=Araneus ventricosus TaxID=182803 RepID=A0A4Y2AAS4_ARAVE|nr:hypothetical protein AVEN_234354-1 [Araneus ventricosus]